MAANTLKKSLLGKIAEVCIVTRDCHKTIEGLARLGIGPFQIFNFNDTTVKNRQFRGTSGDWSLKVAFAKQDALVIEIMQPTGGDSLMSEYLRTHEGRDGVQHIAFDMHDLPMSERKARMVERGFEPAMEGVWLGKTGECHFCFFDTLEATGTVFETIEFSENWQDPDFELFPRDP